MENKGFDVHIWFKEGTPYGVDEIRHNITEIHYLYGDMLNKRDKVAFESDIHGTGGTIKIEYIKEFEAKIATKIADHY